MSGRQTKETNRQIRKAFGEEALDVILHLFTHFLQLQQDRAALFDRVENMSKRIEIQKQLRAEAFEITTNRLNALETDAFHHHAILKRTFFGRLRWLLRGE